MASRQQSITLKQVAAEAGVSIGIASRVLGGYGSFSEKSRLAVLAAAEKLNYRPNGVARSLRRQRTNTIGVLISQISSYHWTTFVQGVEESARRAGYGVVIANTGDDPQREIEYLRDMRERGIDGIIASPLDRNLRLFRQAADSGYPMVTVNVDTGSRRAAVVTSDDRRAGAEAVVYLNALGHLRIGLVAGDQAFETGRSRLESYRAGLEECDLAFDESLVVYGNYRHDEAYEAARRLILMQRPPTAILVCNELMTGAVLRCLHDHLISIPYDISLVGFDDPDWASFYAPSITTLREERHYMGKLACDALLTEIEQPKTPPAAPIMALRTRLVRRESCAAPRAHAALAVVRPQTVPETGPAQLEVGRWSQ